MLAITCTSIKHIAPAEFTLKRFEAMKHKDTVELKKILDEHLVYMHSNGMKESKQEFINAVSSEKIVYKEFRLKEISYRQYHKSIIGNGVINVVGMLNNNPFQVDLFFTEVYHKVNSGWKLVSWQSLKLQ